MTRTCDVLDVLTAIDELESQFEIQQVYDLIGTKYNSNTVYIRNVLSGLCVVGALQRIRKGGYTKVHATPLAEMRRNGALNTVFLQRKQIKPKHQLAVDVISKPEPPTDSLVESIQALTQIPDLITKSIDCVIDHLVKEAETLANYLEGRVNKISDLAFALAQERKKVSSCENKISELQSRINKLMSQKNRLIEVDKVIIRERQPLHSGGK